MSLLVFHLVNVFLVILILLLLVDLALGREISVLVNGCVILIVHFEGRGDWLELGGGVVVVREIPAAGELIIFALGHIY